MKYFPYQENIVYRTHLRPDEIILRLQAVKVADRKFWEMLKPFEENKYHVKTYSRRFEIYRAVSQRNSFIPQIVGDVKPTTEGSDINVKMKLHDFTLAFGYFWCGGLIIITLIIIAGMISEGHFEPVIFGPIAMLFFVYLVSKLTFNSEVKRSTADLKTIFEAEIIKE